MTKTEIKRLTNKLFYENIEKNYPQYELDFEGEGGRIYLIPKNGKKEGIIEYHQSRHECWSYSKDDSMEKILNNDIKTIQQDIEIMILNSFNI